jgi:propionaldehyde dehydrogenase
MIASREQSIAAIAREVLARLELGVGNVLTMAEEATLKNVEEMFQHPKVALICATGGPSVVDAAMKSGKRVIAARA